MIEPRLNEVLEKVSSKYSLIILAARRARQINDYFVSLRRPDILKGRGPVIQTDSDKPLTIALQEIASGEVYGEQLEHNVDFDQYAPGLKASDAPLQSQIKSSSIDEGSEPAEEQSLSAQEVQEEAPPAEESEQAAPKKRTRKKAE